MPTMKKTTAKVNVRAFAVTDRGQQIQTGNQSAKTANKTIF
jgi:hypothetical protein